MTIKDKDPKIFEDKKDYILDIKPEKVKTSNEVDNKNKKFAIKAICQGAVIGIIIGIIAAYLLLTGKIDTIIP